MSVGVLFLTLINLSAWNLSPPGNGRKQLLGTELQSHLEIVLCVVMDGCQEKEAGPLRDLHTTLLGEVQGSVQSGRGQHGTGR